MERRSESVADEIATLLFALELDSLTTSAVTARITGAIVDWAFGRGWLPRIEARVAVALPRGADQSLGFVDVIVRRGGAQPDLAIEIDSTDKPWSVTKLRHAVAGGMHAIWVRWGDEAWAGVYDDLDVIQLQTRRRPALNGRPRDPPGFW